MTRHRDDKHATSASICACKPAARAAHWPAKASKPLQINGEHVSSALLVDETLDAATPFAGSLEVRKLYPHAVLLAEPGGTTHADSLSGNTCVDNTIANYLALGQLPQRKPGSGPDKLCKPLPVPVPVPASASPAAAPRAPAGVPSRPLPPVR